MNIQKRKEENYLLYLHVLSIMPNVKPDRNRCARLQKQIKYKEACLPNPVTGRQCLGRADNFPSSGSHLAVYLSILLA